MKNANRTMSLAFSILFGAFTGALVASNIAAVKPAQIGPVVLPAAIVVFPVTYAIGDVVTEVYGYRSARRMIWAGFAANLSAVLALQAGGALPPAQFWDGQAAYMEILGASPRVLLASLVAYLAGMFANSAVLSRMKAWTGGKLMLPRFWASTVVGEAIDSAVFLLLAFAGAMPLPVLAAMIPAHAGAKVLYEVVASPASAAIAVFLKRVEEMDELSTADFKPPQTGEVGRRSPARDQRERV